MATNQRLQGYKDRLTEIQQNYFDNGNKFTNSAEQAEYNAIQTILHGSENAASATLQKSVKEGKGALDALTGKPTDTSINPPAANVVNPKPKQEIQKYQGHTYRLKEGKDGTKQSDWEQLD
jgi:hypothetical protein